MYDARIVTKLNLPCGLMVQGPNLGLGHKLNLGHKRPNMLSRSRSWTRTPVSEFFLIKRLPIRRETTFCKGSQVWLSAGVEWHRRTFFSLFHNWCCLQLPGAWSSFVFIFIHRCAYLVAKFFVKYFIDIGDTPSKFHALMTNIPNACLACLWKVKCHHRSRTISQETRT